MAPVKGLLKKSKRKSHLLTIGNREIETHGLDTGFWRDLYHRSLTVHWPVLDLGERPSVDAFLIVRKHAEPYNSGGKSAHEVGTLPLNRLSN